MYRSNITDLAVQTIYTRESGCVCGALVINISVLNACFAEAVDWVGEPGGEGRSQKNKKTNKTNNVLHYSLTADALADRT